MTEYLEHHVSLCMTVMLLAKVVVDHMRYDAKLSALHKVLEEIKEEVRK